MSTRLRILALLFFLTVLCGYFCLTSAQTGSMPTPETVASDPLPSPSDARAVADNSTGPAHPDSSQPGASQPNAAAGAPSAAAASAPDTKTEPDVKPAEGLKSKIDSSYIVGVADSLFISVWKEPDFSGPAVVRPDGIITLPVVGDVHVAGLTPPQVQDLLTTKLKEIVAEPQVTVVVRDIRSRKAYLVGKVGHPGAVLLTSPETVLQLLAEAGGPNQFAKPQSMYILRTVDGSQKRIPFNYRKALKGSQADVQVMVGDIIVVP